MTLFEELKRRGLIAQMTNEEKIQDLLDNQKIHFYIGFDATADSLHVGHFLQLVVMAHMQRAGHTPIALLGTGTTMVGDPSGKTDMRKMLTPEIINHNAECFRKQMSKFINFKDDKALIVRNGDWLLKLNFIDFMRTIGVHFSVNRMLSAECFKSRLETGLSFFEFSYMLMQSYDFLRLHEDYNCMMQLGGDDQWSNIIGGIELVRKVKGNEVYGMTFTLLTTREGKKMGKTEKGALWLDEEKVSPYEFFQYWRNVSDDDVINCLKLITFLPIEEIEEMERTFKGSELNKAKELLAFEVTKMVHGEDAAQKALDTAKSLFGANQAEKNMPQTQLETKALSDGQIGLLDLLVTVGLCPSKGEARRLIQQGGISINDCKVTDVTAEVSRKALAEGIVIKKGKKVYHKVYI